MQFFFIILTMFALTACTPPLSKNEMLVDKMTAKYHRLMNEEEQMIVQGSGGGMINGLSLLNYIYACPKLVDLEEARRINLRCIKKFFTMINNDLEVRPCLAEYPYPIKGLHLVIVFYPYDLQNPHIQYNNVYKTFFIDGLLIYREYNMVEKTEGIIFKETYEEALQRAGLCEESGQP